MQAELASRLLTLAENHYASFYSTTNGNMRHVILENENVCVFIVGKPKKSYSELEDRTRRRRNAAFTSFTEILQMSPHNVLDLAISTGFLGRGELRKILKDVSSNVRKRVAACGFPAPLTPLQSVAMLLSRSYTERDAEFIRRFFGKLPPVKELRDARYTLIASLPSVFTLRKGHSEWREEEKGRFSIGCNADRDILCAKMSLREALTCYLSSAHESDLWPKLPPFSMIPSSELNDTVAVQLSVDTGGGTTKLMLKVMRDGGSQSVWDVILLGEAQSMKETFDELSTVFGSVGEEVKEISSHGLSIEGRRYSFLFFFVGDFKVYYSLLGMKSAVSSYPCPWCRCPLQKMDKYLRHLTSVDISPRPPLLNFQSNSLGTVWQNPNTHNVFNLTTNLTSWESKMLLVPPPLHIKLGIVNKILESLVSIVAALQDKYDVEPGEKCEFNNHLSSALSKVGARREMYYAGTLSGSPCSNLMKNMSRFCDMFFDTKVAEYGTVSEELPTVSGFASNLVAVADMFNDSSTGERRGIGYYMAYQGKWSRSP